MDRGMEMGEDGMVEPVASLPGASRLEEILRRSKLISKKLDIGFWDIHMVDIKFRYNGQDVWEEADWIVDLWRMVREAKRSGAPEPAPGEGSPSHPSGPSQDSQEVAEAIETLRGFAKRWCDDGQCRNINGYSHDPECRDFYNAIDAVEAALSQSPKGTAGADEEGEAHARSIPEAARIKLEEAQAVFAPYNLAGQGNYGRGLPVNAQRKVWDCIVMAKSFLGEAGGDGPSAPKTGLQGAPRLEDAELWLFGGDLIFADEAGGLSLEVYSQDAERLFIRREMNREQAAKIRDWFHEQYPAPAPGDVGEAGGVA